MEFTQWRNGVIQDLDECPLRVTLYRLEGKVSGEELKECDTSGIDIRPCVDYYSTYLFGRHVEDAANDLAGPGLSFAAADSRNTGMRPTSSR